MAAEAENNKKQGPEAKIFKIPGEIFEDFKEIDKKNEEIFMHISYQIVLKFIIKES